MNATPHDLFQSGKRWDTGAVKDHYAACAVCGAPVSRNARQIMVDITTGRFIESMAHEEVVPWPIGSECVKKHPELKPFLMP